MTYLDNNINYIDDAEFDFGSEDEVILEQNFRTYKELTENKKDFWLTDYIYYSNDDDDTIPDFISDVVQTGKSKKLVLSNDGKNDDLAFVGNKLSRDKSNISNNDVNNLMQRNGWKIVSLVNKLNTSTNVTLYISYQIYNKKHYIVISKVIGDRTPRNFAMPVSIAEFVANRIFEAFSKKDRVEDVNVGTQRKWVLCKQYGTIYPHPNNYITISHQKYKTKDYIVLAKYDWRKKPRTFVFNMDFSKEIRDILLKEYKRGKRNGEKIYQYSFK